VENGGVVVVNGRCVAFACQLKEMLRSRSRPKQRKVVTKKNWSTIHKKIRAILKNVNV